MRYGCFLQVGNDGIQHVRLMFSVDRRLPVAYYLELVRLRYSPQGIDEHGSVVLRPEIYVQGVQGVHVLSIASRIRDGQMPLRHVLLRARSTTPTLASKSIDRDGEEARVFIRLFYLDRVQVYVEARISSVPHVKH
jgi:hypothetical protein